MFAIDLADSAQLRPLEPWQAEEFLAHMDRARAHVDAWIPWAGLSTDLESATRTLQRYADLAARDAGRLYGIWLDDVLIGGTMFVSFDAGRGKCEIGCWLEPAGTGHGLVTTAVRLLIDWAITRRGLYRVEWKCRQDNTASVNVAKRLGMRLDGTLRGDFPYQGVRHDTQLWAMIAPDWTGTPAT